MFDRKTIKVVSITQSNDQKCHGNGKTARRIRRTADKKRRQFLGKELREEMEGR